MWTGGSWLLEEHKKYVWDGWKLLLELHMPATGAPTVVRKYTWGLDLAGLMGAAGGVGVSPAFLEAAGTIGGLLAVDDAGREGDRIAYFYDANGNVTEVVNLKDLGSGGTPDFTWAPARLLAHYEYDPYGNRTNAAPPDEYNQPWRFSTKQWDVYTGLSYYGYRYYSAGLGRWISRDPLQEKVGLHLLAYVRNDPFRRVDPLGTCDHCGGSSDEWAARNGALGPYGNCQGWDDRMHRFLAMPLHQAEWNDFASSYYLEFLAQGWKGTRNILLPDKLVRKLLGSSNPRLRDAIQLQLDMAAAFSFRDLACNEEQIFVACGAEPGTRNWGSAIAIVGIGNFTVFWRSICTIGPKECCGTNPNIGRVDYECTTAIMVYDLYDFAPNLSSDSRWRWLSLGPWAAFEVLPKVAHMGSPFEEFGFSEMSHSGEYSTCATD